MPCGASDPHRVGAAQRCVRPMHESVSVACGLVRRRDATHGPDVRDERVPLGLARCKPGPGCRRPTAHDVDRDHVLFMIYLVYFVVHGLTSYPAPYAPLARISGRAVMHV